MKQRQLGNTELKISEMGFGCSSLGGGLFHKDDKEALAALNRAFDSGVNFFDTSDSYSFGNSEKLLGQAFKTRRDQVIIASKVGKRFKPLGAVALMVRPYLSPISGLFNKMKRTLHGMRESQQHYDYSHAHIMDAIEKSLIRLQTDYLDIYQLYNPTPEVLEHGEVFDTFRLLKRQGKIRHFGVSCVTVDDAFTCLDVEGIGTIQVTLNLLDFEASLKFLELAQQKNIGVIARVPLAQGLLTDADSDTMADNTLRDLKELMERRRRAAQFRFLVHKDRTLAQSAIQYSLGLPGVSVVIPGMVNQQQLTENLAALDAPSLSAEEMKKIKALQLSWQ